MLVIEKGLVAVLVAACLTPVTIAQRSVDPVSEVTRFNVSGGYQYTRANAPPGGCQCFSLNGGYVSAGLQFNQWLGVEGQFSQSHAGNISMLGQDLTLATYMAGPRVSWHVARLSLYGEGLLGRAHGSNSYFPSGTSYSSSASSLAYSGGGGVEYGLTPRFGLRLMDVQYLHTAFPNGTTNVQSHLSLGVGLVVRFRGREPQHAQAAAVEIPNRVLSLACSANTAQVQQGQIIEVNAKASTLRPQGDVNYTWTASGGSLQGAGHRITIDTRATAPGDYVVNGRAILSGAEDASDCEVTFHVMAKPEPQIVTRPVQPAPVQVAATKAVDTPQSSTGISQSTFHQDVPEPLFDYDQYAIRPDAAVAIAHAAHYLLAHPELRVLVGGYSDERGTAEFNMTLGLKRANAVRNALIAAGVGAERIQVISYGKGAQVCTAENEECWQQNRRAALSLQQ